MDTHGERCSVALVAGSDPENFAIVWFASDMQITRIGFFSEAELRSPSKEMGLADAEIDAIIERARERPK